jgi:hypothetical protein
MSPIINLTILEKVKEKGKDVLGKYKFNELKAYTRREWFGQESHYFYTWHKAFAKLNDPEEQKNYPNLMNYLKAGIQNGPILPHFYNEKGQNAFRGFLGLIEFGELPFFMIDVETLDQTKFPLYCTEIDFHDMMSKENLGFKPPIVREGDKYLIFNNDSKTYEDISNFPWIKIQEKENEKRIVFDYNQITEQDKIKYSIPDPDKEVALRGAQGLGFDEIAVFANLGTGIKIEDGHSYVPYQMSLMKIMFLTLGIDADNNVITEGHPQYEVHQELVKLVSDKENVWNSNNFNKDMLLQFQIAEMFKKDPNLYEAAKQVVDSTIGLWKNYKNLKGGKYYNQNKEKIGGSKKIEDYILGDEQALAYYFMQQLRIMWYSSANPEVLMKALEIDFNFFPAKLFHRYIKKKLTSQKTIRYPDHSPLSGYRPGKASFMDVWSEIKVQLKGQTKRLDFISFDDHGWVISFDPAVIEEQRQSPTLHDPQFMEEMGFAGIESWLSSELNLWYKKAE